ncbi:response regulator [Polynucleobacter sp. CS-Odin-A6]|uniref:response regulator n=1 Tax=Polynucleobacter sp. CS-Odin-A6 TaxID=2689106 RepID=UPI001C0BEACB|nr:response regulator [Polynucleobacter sp. CS-Odin-A6]MBU3620913.1 response regulator [Polynucleobacter sp. CS-Odin-A6]
MAKILIVEDNQLNLELSRDILTFNGHEVEHAEDCEACLSKVDAFMPDLILMDIGLPGISGVDCFKLLRQKSGFDKVPVLAFTASVMPDEIKKITDTGFSGLIEKPIRVSTFLSTINDALEVK